MADAPLILQFTFAQVSTAIANMHDIGPRGISAFQARLKHYQKQGFPRGLNTGRGKAASYLVEHAIQLALAIELNQMGIGPDRAIDIIKLNFYRWLIAVRMALRERGTSENNLPMFIYFDPTALDSLQEDGSTDRADATFHYNGMGQLVENLTAWADAGLRRIALVNISSMMATLVENLSTESGINPISIATACLAWATEDHDDYYPET